MFPIAAGVADPRSPGGRPASWAATGRSGGTSLAPYDSLNLAGYVDDDEAAVAENRRRLAGALGLPGERLVVMDSVHGADVAVVTGPGVVPGVDALLTQEPDLAIVALGADCVPIVLIGDDDRTVAVAHCGWRGLVADVLGAVVGAMADHGSTVALAILGPSVCGRCYPVPPERAAEVAGAWPGPVAEAALVACADGQPGIDVRRGAAARLAGLGVAPEAIAWAGGCTVEDPGLFSYRRDGVTGRQGVAACRHRLARMDA
jgi:purine-nucleoside/S-methyl-5'-thioadenosine phosphorylase / adenosine deaminase